MNEEAIWRSLHDATLESIELRWSDGELRIRLRTGHAAHPRLVVVASGVSHLACGRQMPWGPSVSIHEARGPVRDHDGKSMGLELEMQTGDVIRIDAADIRVRAES